MRRPTLTLEPGSFARWGWTHGEYTNHQVPFSAATATVNGYLDAVLWERLRWGDEWTDAAGPALYLHVRALLPGEPEGGERVVFRVRSALDVGRYVWAVDDGVQALAVVNGVRLARDARGGGGWAWVLDLVRAARWRRERRAERDATDSDSTKGP